MTNREQASTFLEKSGVKAADLEIPLFPKVNSNSIKFISPEKEPRILNGDPSNHSISNWNDLSRRSRQEAEKLSGRRPVPRPFRRYTPFVKRNNAGPLSKVRVWLLRKFT
jgi:hypothetical protein